MRRAACLAFASAAWILAASPPAAFAQTNWTDLEPLDRGGEPQDCARDPGRTGALVSAWNNQQAAEAELNRREAFLRQVVGFNPQRIQREHQMVRLARDSARRSGDKDKALALDARLDLLLEADLLAQTGDRLDPRNNSYLNAIAEARALLKNRQDAYVSEVAYCEGRPGAPAPRPIDAPPRPPVQDTRPFRAVLPPDPPAGQSAGPAMTADTASWSGKYTDGKAFFFAVAGGADNASFMGSSDRSDVPGKVLIQVLGCVRRGSEVDCPADGQFINLGDESRTAYDFVGRLTVLPASGRLYLTLTLDRLRPASPFFPPGIKMPFVLTRVVVGQ